MTRLRAIYGARQPETSLLELLFLPVFFVLGWLASDMLMRNPITHHTYSGVSIQHPTPTDIPTPTPFYDLREGSEVTGISLTHEDEL